MKWFRKHSGKFCVLFYLLVLFHLSNLCMYGGLTFNLLLIFLTMGCLIAAFAVWFTSGKHEKGKFRPAMIVLLVMGTLIFGIRIVYSAIPYNGELSWFLDDIVSRKKVELKHDNFFDTGMKGILDDLEQEVELPEELYIEDDIQIAVDNMGEIQHFHFLLYGKDGEGKTTEYQMDYYHDDSKKLNMRVNKDVRHTFDPDKKLDPMLCILENAPYQEQITRWSRENPYNDYMVVYEGRRTFARAEGLIYLPGDVDGDGEVSGAGEISEPKAGERIRGYEVTVYAAYEEDMAPVRYIMEPEYLKVDSDGNIDIEKMDLEQMYTEVDWETEEDGTVTYFVHERKGWRLVMDEASGSGYKLQITRDGGEMWKNVNVNPFPDDAGIACGLRFYNDNLAFAMTTDGSGSTANVYVTWDGGKNFEKVQLPQVREEDLPDQGRYGTYEEYGYLCMPVIGEDELHMELRREEWDDAAILFRSPDRGKTWLYYGTTEM